MSCKEVIPLLSAFHDGELTLKQRQLVSDHVESCLGCSQKLESLQRLSDLVDSVPTPEAPITLLGRIEQTLETPRVASHSLSKRRLAAVLCAAAVLVAVCIIGWQLQKGPAHTHEEMAHVFGEFLISFERGLSNTDQLLAQRYQGVLVDEAGATAALKRKTVARPVVLSGNHVSKRFLLKMPCCDCVQTIYSREGTTSFVLLEHENEQFEWFQNRPMIRAACHGKACCMVQLESSLAASWPVDGGFVTVVGVRDVTELEKLVEQLQPL
jgi:hypothetical protein